MKRNLKAGKTRPDSLLTKKAEPRDQRPLEDDRNESPRACNTSCPVRCRSAGGHKGAGGGTNKSRVAQKRRSACSFFAPPLPRPLPKSLKAEESRQWEQRCHRRRRDQRACEASWHLPCRNRRDVAEGAKDLAGSEEGGDDGGDHKGGGGDGKLHRGAGDGRKELVEAGGDGDDPAPATAKAGPNILENRIL